MDQKRFDEAAKVMRELDKHIDRDRLDDRDAYKFIHRYIVALSMAHQRGVEIEKYDEQLYLLLKQNPSFANPGNKDELI